MEIERESVCVRVCVWRWGELENGVLHWWGGGKWDGARPGRAREVRRERAEPNEQSELA